MSKPNYSFVDATFAFFQAVGRRPGGALWITFWHLALYAGLTAVIVALMAPFFTMIFTIAAQGREPTPEEILPAASGLIGAYALAMLGFLAASLVVQGAWLRLLARDEVAPIIPLRFGGDELRLLVNVILALVIGIAAVIVMLRFAAAPALSVRLKGIKLFESFSATKGVAGWMFVSYVTIIALYIVGYVVVATIQNIVVLLAAADMLPTLAALENTEDPEVVLRVLGDLVTQPSVVIAFALVILIQIPLQIVFEGSWHGVGAYVARREAGDYPSDTVETPSASVGDAPSEG